MGRIAATRRTQAARDGVQCAVHLRTRTLLLSLLVASACGDDNSPAETDGGTGEGTSSTGSTSLSDTTTGGSTTTGSSSESGVDESGSESSTTTGGEEPVEPLPWQTDCVVNGYDLSRLHPELECTSIEVPLDWDAPDGDTIQVGALRIPAATEERVGTFWALDGGPGGSGLGYPLDEGWREEIREAGWDIIIPPHRGTFSPLLECTSAPQSTDCRLQLESIWGDGLRHFNTVQAARDVGEFIRREQADDDDRVVVYGVSYGTLWAEVYAGQHPEQADAIILDSVLPANADTHLEEYLIQEVSEELLQACVDDPVCGPRVGFESGAEFSAAVIEAIDGGDCGAGDLGLWADSNIRLRFGQLMNLRHLRNYIPLLAAMLTRCDPALNDIVEDSSNALFGTLAASLRPVEQFPFGPGLTSDDEPLASGPPPFDLLYSGPLSTVVVATTLLRSDADPPVVSADARNHFASLGFIDNIFIEIAANWGDLPKVEFDRDFVSQTPMIAFNADYDLQTVLPWAELVAEQHGIPLVRVADGAHGLTRSDTGGKSLDGESCARAIMLAFMDDPLAPVDDSCAQNLPPLDVNLERPDLANRSMTAFGTTDPWSLLPPL